MDQQQQLDDNDHMYGLEEKGEEDVAGKIFIGGLSWQTTEQTLRAHFERYGELTDVALMFDKRSNKPRGFGFVKMKDPQAAEAIMSDEHTIDGRLVDVKRALPRDKAPGPANKSESCKIFVGGLPPDVLDADFAEYFKKFGPVKDAIVMVDRNTNSSRGFGFITFEQEESVTAVLKLSHELRGKPVEVKRAEPRDSNNRGGFDSFGQNNYRHGGGRRDGPQGGGRYGNPQGGRNDYGGSNFNGGYMNGGSRPGAGGFNNRFPATGNYGGGFRGASPYGVPAVGGYGYPTGAPMNPQGMGFYGGALPGAGGAGAPANGGYGGYGAAGASSMGAPQSGYGGAAPSYGSQPNARAGEGFPSAGGNDFRSGVQGDANTKGPYDSAAVAAAGYASAAMQQMRSQPFPYGGAAPMQSYSGNYGYPGAQPGQGAAPLNRGSTGTDNNTFGGDQGYGAYRGQGTVEGRAGRSYRPY